MVTQKLYFEFNNETPKVGDIIVKVFLENKDSKLGEVRTIIEDNSPTTYHMKLDDGSGYNKFAEHGWRKLIKVDYDNCTDKKDGEVAVAFAEWLIKENWQCREYDTKIMKWSYRKFIKDKEQIKTTAELYEKFLSAKATDR